MGLDEATNDGEASRYGGVANRDTSPSGRVGKPNRVALRSFGLGEVDVGDGGVCDGVVRAGIEGQGGNVAGDRFGGDIEVLGGGVIEFDLVTDGVFAGEIAGSGDRVGGDVSPNLGRLYLHPPIGELLGAREALSNGLEGLYNGRC